MTTDTRSAGTTGDRSTEQAVELLIVHGLEIRAGRDGIWMTFAASDGLSMTINVGVMAEGRIGICGRALKQWCRDRWQEALAKNPALGSPVANSLSNGG